MMPEVALHFRVPEVEFHFREKTTGSGRKSEFGILVISCKYPASTDNIAIQETIDLLCYFSVSARTDANTSLSIQMVNILLIGASKIKSPI